MSLLTLPWVQTLIEAKVASSDELLVNKDSPKLLEKLQQLYDVYVLPETQGLINNKIIFFRRWLDFFELSYEEYTARIAIFRKEIQKIYLFYQINKEKIDLLFKEKVLNFSDLHRIYLEYKFKKYIDDLFELFSSSTMKLLIQADVILPKHVNGIFFYFVSQEYSQENVYKAKHYFNHLSILLKEPKIKELLAIGFISSHIISDYIFSHHVYSRPDFEIRISNNIEKLYEMYHDYAKPLISSGAIDFTFCRKILADDDCFLDELLRKLKKLTEFYQDPIIQNLIKNKIIYPCYLKAELDHSQLRCNNIDYYKRNVFPILNKIAFTQEMKEMMHQLIKSGILTYSNVYNFHFENENANFLAQYFNDLWTIASLQPIQKLLKKGFNLKIHEEYERYKAEHANNVSSKELIKYFSNFKTATPWQLMIKKYLSERAFTYGALLGAFGLPEVATKRMTDYVDIKEAKNLSKVNQWSYNFAFFHKRDREQWLEEYGNSPELENANDHTHKKIKLN